MLPSARLKFFGRIELRTRVIDVQWRLESAGSVKHERRDLVDGFERRPGPNSAGEAKTGAAPVEWTAEGSRGPRKLSCTFEVRRKPVCGELLILGKSVIRHTQVLHPIRRISRVCLQAQKGRFASRFEPNSLIHRLSEMGPVAALVDPLAANRPLWPRSRLKACVYGGLVRPGCHCNRARSVVPVRSDSERSGGAQWNRVERSVIRALIE